MILRCVVVPELAVGFPSLEFSTGCHWRVHTGCHWRVHIPLELSLRTERQLTLCVPGVPEERQNVVFLAGVRAPSVAVLQPRFVVPALAGVSRQ